MPAPWLVTRPPTLMRPSVAHAVSTAKRCSPRSTFGCSMKSRKTNTAAAFPNRGGFPVEHPFRLLHLEGEVEIHRAILDLNLLGHGAGFAMRGFDGVLAGGDILDREGPVLAADGEV